MQTFKKFQNLHSSKSTKRAGQKSYRHLGCIPDLKTRQHEKRKRIWSKYNYILMKYNRRRRVKEHKRIHSIGAYTNVYYKKYMKEEKIEAA